MFFNIRPLAAKWFSEDTPVNYKTAIATIGTDDNGTVTIKHEKMTTADVVSVVVAESADAELSAVYSDGKLTITLGTDSLSAADDTKNIAELIATEISSIDGFTATVNGTGETPIDTATTEDVPFTDGHFGTPCHESGIGFVYGSTYYVCVSADNTKFNNNWRTFTLNDY